MSACSICGNQSHGLRICPELVNPLKDGFFSPQGGSGGGGGEEEEDTVKNYTRLSTVHCGNIICIQPPFFDAVSVSSFSENIF
jgi:hypothetical protein